MTRDEYIEHVVSQAPPLRPEQIALLTAIFAEPENARTPSGKDC